MSLQSSSGTADGFATDVVEIASMMHVGQIADAQDALDAACLRYPELSADYKLAVVNAYLDLLTS